MTAPSRQREYVEKINRVFDYIKEHPGKSFVVPELAKIASFSEYHFHRVFKELVGESVQRYIRRIRLEESAKALLYSPEKSTSSISYECGFSSPANFTKAFRKQFNITPTEFRKQKRKEFEKFGCIDCDRSEGFRVHDCENADIEIKLLEPVRVAYIRQIHGYGSGVRDVWKRLIHWGATQGVSSQNSKLLGIFYDDPRVTKWEYCRFDGCIQIPPSVSPSGEIGKQIVPGGLHALYRFQVEKDNFHLLWKHYKFLLSGITRSGYVPVNNHPVLEYFDLPEYSTSKSISLAFRIKIKLACP